MRLLYITNSRMPTEKAHGLQIAKTIEALVRAGCTVRLLIPSRKNHIKTNIADFYNIQDGLMSIARVPDVVRLLQYVSESLYFPLQRVWFALVAFFCGLFWRGTVYSRDITASFLLALAGKQIVYEDHQPKSRFKELYEFFLKRIPKKVVVARGLVDEYRAMDIPEASYVCAPNGVDIAEFDAVSRDASLWNREFGIKPGMPVALYVGHFYSWKGVYTIVDAAKDIRAAVVLIGGTKEDYAKVAQYVKECSISNTYLRSFTPHKEVIRFIKSADVLLLPNTAHEERSQKYTTPIKLFEYMASGVPIVASSIASFTPYLAHNKNALLCEPDSPDDLARSVNRVMRNPDQIKHLPRAARESVKQYTWDSRARMIMDFI
ncbi:MAG: glycosyltransferase family 4 protein [Parcubacteria group bacterium]|nr:glycosyltransferase family 4 protein [Parcubacteria group bacterium]